MMPFGKIKIDTDPENAVAAATGLGAMAALNWETLLAASVESFFVAAFGAFAVHLVNLLWKRGKANKAKRSQNRTKPPKP